MVKKRDNEKPLPPAMLLVSKEEAFEKINNRIELGNKIKNYKITSLTELKNAQSEFYTWTEFNEELLSRIFDNSTIKDGYRKTISIGGGEQSLTEEIDELKEDVEYYVRKLESIRDRIEI